MKKKLFEMEPSLSGDAFDTKKEDRKKVENKEIVLKDKHQLVFKYEKRNGKNITIVGRFYCDENSKKEVLKLLKKKLACGGTISNEWIEIQGDLKEKISEVLQKDGWKIRRK